MSKLDKDQVIENFTKAYSAANGKEPTIEAGGGWYSVDGGKKVRLAALDEMATELSSTPAKAEPAKKKPAAKKVETKPSTPTETPKTEKPVEEKKAAATSKKEEAVQKNQYVK